MTPLDRSILRPSLVAGARIAVGRGARYSHRELARCLDPISCLGYALALAIAMSQLNHEQRANVVANAIVLAGVLHDGATLYESESSTW